LQDKQIYFVEHLLEWYKKNQRKLPFRETKDPYKIWVSEVMLQQTRVGAVINKIENKYLQFIERFPDIEILANSKTEEILELWSGLGYYNRAKNLHQTARIICEKYSGKFPDSYQDLIQLPGIGDYTASAILSIAFNKPYAVVDGNVKRLLFRFFYNELDQTYSEKGIKNLANELIHFPKVEPSEFNQSLMEMGALVCVYKYPKCNNCLISSYCSTKDFSKEEKLNIPPKSINPKKQIKIYIYIMNKDNKLFIIKNQHLFLKNHYFFPYEIKEKKEHLEISDSPHTFLGNFKHNIMNYLFDAYIFLVNENKKNFTFYQQDKTESKWIEVSEIKKYLYSSFAKKVLDLYNNSSSLF
jgi:A/G-specific adenine glycosylase